MKNLWILTLTAVLVLPVLPVRGDVEVPVRFAATVTGQGSDVILMPGLASSAAVWDATAQQLALTHRVHVLQVAGFAGQPASANGDGPLLAPLIQAIADYAAALDRPALIGHSLGGLIGLEIAAKRTEAIDRLLVVDALPFYPLVFNPSATVENVQPQAAMLRDQILSMSDAQYAQVQSATVLNLVKTEVARASVLEWSLTSDRRVVARAMYEDMTTDARADLKTIKIPVTVVYAWDPAMGLPAATVDALYTSAYANLAGAKLVRIDNTFHFIMKDQRDAFAQEVERFLR